MSEVSHKATMRAMVAAVIIVGFFVAYFLDPTNDIFRGAIVAAFATAVGYYLGSSQGAHENREHMNRAHDAAIDAVTGKAKPPAA